MPYFHAYAINIPKQREKLTLTLKVLSKMPSMRNLACMAKNKLDIRTDASDLFPITFRSIADFLKCYDKKWELLGDSPVMIT